MNYQSIKIFFLYIKNTTNILTRTTSVNKKMKCSIVLKVCSVYLLVRVTGVNDLELWTLSSLCILMSVTRHHSLQTIYRVQSSWTSVLLFQGSIFSDCRCLCDNGPVGTVLSFRRKNEGKSWPLALHEGAGAHLTFLRVSWSFLGNISVRYCTRTCTFEVFVLVYKRIHIREAM